MPKSILYRVVPVQVSIHEARGLKNVRWTGLPGMKLDVVVSIQREPGNDSISSETTGIRRSDESDNCDWEGETLKFNCPVLNEGQNYKLAVLIRHHRKLVGEETVGAFNLVLSDETTGHRVHQVFLESGEPHGTLAMCVTIGEPEVIDQNALEESGAFKSAASTFLRKLGGVVVKAILFPEDI